jgi:phosphatidylserine/phosphatidylglycerophosphate/cardiolipin synthase-like enzyme
MKNNYLLILIVFLLLLAACTTQTETPLPPVPITTQNSGSDAQIEVFFSNPDDPNAGRYRGGPDEALAEAIRNAEFSVDAAIYDLNLWSIRDALLAAQDAGVQVRIVAESDYLDETEFQELQQAGIEILGDRRESLMHNKYVVIDQLDVWTGSMNFTVNGAYRNDNNLIHIRSSKLAENYTSEFEEMFVDDMFGNNTVPQTPNPSLTIDGILVETSFSPDDGTADQIIQAIQSADESIRFLAFSFTSDPIAEALLARAADGVTVSGVFEQSQYKSNTGTEYDNLLAAGLDVRLDGNPKSMHHKVFIIDDDTVITGSYNFSQSAEERNDENTLIIHDPEIAALYLAEFERVFGKAQQP